MHKKVSLFYIEIFFGELVTVSFSLSILKMAKHPITSLKVIILLMNWLSTNKSAKAFILS